MAIRRKTCFLNYILSICVFVNYFMLYYVKIANIAVLLIQDSLGRCVNTESKRTIKHIIFIIK